MARLLKLLSEDRADLVVLVVYTVITGLLALATPLAVQALVNTVAASTVQPLVVLSLVVLIGLSASGVVALLQLSLVETIQQRLFARSGLRIAQRLIQSASSALSASYGPELANRFFDVLTIQKSLAKILLDGLGAIFQAIVGLILLAFYDQSGLLLGFDLLVLVFVGFIIFPLGIGGLRTSQAESVEKYALAGWLEELARCNASFKLHAAPAFLMARAESTVQHWLKERRRHFGVTFRQEAGNQLFQACASAGVLAIGGFLVVQQKLTLGQLVAAQLIVAQVLKAIDKLIRQAETVYDLLTGLDKTGYLTDLEVESDGARPVPSLSSGGARVTCRDLQFAYPGGREILMGLELTLEPGERVSLVGASGAGKSTLAALMSGLELPNFGFIEINGVETRTALKSSLRQVVTVVGYDNAIFDGTVEENIVVGRTALTTEDVNRAIAMACLTDDIALLANGLQTRLLPNGLNISRGQAQRILIARALVDRPQLLILDEAFTGIDERTSLQILDAIFAEENGWTIIDISHEGAVVARAERVHVLADGRIVESGTTKELAARPEGEFVRLFPQLSQMILSRRLS